MGWKDDHSFIRRKSLTAVLHVMVCKTDNLFIELGEVAGHFQKECVMKHGWSMEVKKQVC